MMPTSIPAGAALPARPARGWPGQGAMKAIKPTAIGLFAAATGGACVFTTNVIGQAYYGELLLPVVALCAGLMHGERRSSAERMFWRLLIACAVSLFGFVLSDMIRGSNPQDYLRGWGRIILVASDFVCLSVLASQDRRNLWWFVAGFGIIGVLYLRLAFHLPLALWKFDENHDRGYGLYMVMACAALAYLIPTRLAALGFVFLAYKSFFFDYRSLAAICTAIAVILWVRRNEGRQWKISRQVTRQNVQRIAAVGALAALAVYAGLQLNNASFQERRESSDMGRQFMWHWGISAALRSPIIGYGSWAQSQEILDLQSQISDKDFGGSAGVFVNGNAGGIHSEILGSWVEGGILGAGFFIYLGFVLARNFTKGCLYRRLDALSPIIMFAWMNNGFDLFIAPVGAPSRIFAGMAAAAVVIVAQERTAARRTARAALRAAPPQMAMRRM